MTELLISEKPNAAKKIVEALADSKVKTTKYKNIYYYEFKHNDKDIIVCCAVGHLFTLAEKERKFWKYPIFDFEWKPSYEVSKSSAFSKPYTQLIAKLAKKCDEFTVCTDYDIEGSVIGYNCIRFLCKKKDGKRMKFSTLTKDELRESYDKASKHLDFPQIEAGEARHSLDWLWGLNISRALTLSIKNATGRFKVLSSGRVQGPTLKLIVDKEKEIAKFVPEPYWEIHLKGILNKKEIHAQHKKGKLKDKKEAEEIIKKTKGKPAIVEETKKKTTKQSPPNPFDLTSLQTEAYKCLKITPKETLKSAQDLYTAGLISYPRTSSQKLPKSIGYKKILTNLSKVATLSQPCKALLAKKILKPNEGKKKDQAHPAIYPTGEFKKLEGKSAQLFSLIIRRFLATFADPAKRETITITIDVNKEQFIASGTRTVEPGWIDFYGRFAKFKEEELPAVKKGDKVDPRKINSLKKETQPPKRYSPASIIKAMESLNLGTKATRSSIVDALYQRHYVKDQQIKATLLGTKTIEALEKFCPEIIDVKLTEHFEKEMEEIQNKKKKPEEVIKEAKKILEKILKNFKKKEKEIGKSLTQATIVTTREANEMGVCPVCKKGKLRVLFSKKSKKRFLACDQYPKCKTTFSLPQKGLVKSTDAVCKECGFPIVLIINKGKRPWRLCINPNCKTKEDYYKSKQI